MAKDVTFQNRGVRIAAHLHLPNNFQEDRKYPALVGIHPAGGVKEQTIGLYAQQLAAHDFVVLVYDSSYQGASGGEPRLLEDPTTRSFVDTERMGVFGVCAGGGYALAVAQTERRFKAVAGVSATPMGEAARRFFGSPIPPAEQIKSLEAAATARTATANGADPVYIPFVPEKLEDINDSTPTTQRGGRFLMTSMDKMLAFSTFQLLPTPLTQPLLLIAGSEADTKIYSDEAYALSEGPKELFVVKDATHIALYDKPEYCNPDKQTMTPKRLRVETCISHGIAQDMVSSLIVGSQAAVLVDVPLTIPQAKELVPWIRSTANVPLVAIFATHFHPDHYLAAHIIVESFPGANLYATEKTVGLINDIIEGKTAFWKSALGDENIASSPTIPKPFPSTFLSLPGDDIVHLLGPVNGDSPEQTMFWIPSIKTLIAGDVVYGHGMHMWLADLDDPSMTEAWLDSLRLIKSLDAERIIPGHALSDQHNFNGSQDMEHTRAYVRFFQTEIESKPKDTFTPEEITAKFDQAFPELADTGEGSTSKLLLQINAQHFGRGGQRQKHDVDLVALQKSYNASWDFSKN
ncbi:metallo-beta-lactamase protein [Fusarium bulbicola]|nr:metallo-beta-lactamase protein [Fusarium bulbicola]